WDIFSVLPRSGDDATRGAGRVSTAAGAAGPGAEETGEVTGTGWPLLLPTGVGSSLACCEPDCCDPDCCEPACCERAASSTSCLRIRPPTPVPLTLERSTPFSAASLRTSGVTYAPAESSSSRA